MGTLRVKDFWIKGSDCAETDESTTLLSAILAPGSYLQGIPTAKQQDQNRP
jgi:hypothetical protein